MRLRERGPEFHLVLNNRFEGLKFENADVDERCQLISDTLMEVAAEIASHGKRKKQITEEDTAIENKNWMERERITRNTGQNYFAKQLGTSDNKGAGEKLWSR